MKCPRCGRDLLDPAALAAQADAVRAAVAGAVSLMLGGAELEASYGGTFGLKRALEEHFLKAEGLALEHARATACLAGACIVPPANEPTSKREP